MLTIRVKAGSITHLTDARYFAALGVEWLGINLDALHDPVQDYKEIVDWVEGPIIVPESAEYSPVDWDGFVQMFQPKLIQSKIPTAYDAIQIEAGEGLRLITVDNAAQLDKYVGVQEVIVDITSLSLSEIEPEMIRKLYAIQICGAEEERPGFKSYDELDEFFEAFMPE